MTKHAKALLLHDLAQAVASTARAAKTDIDAENAVADILRNNIFEITTDPDTVGARVRIRVSSDLGYCKAERA